MAIQLSYSVKRSVLSFLKIVNNASPGAIDTYLTCSKKCGIVSNAFCSSYFSALSVQRQNDLSAAAAGQGWSCFVPSRSYGRKVRPKPQKITNFEYSGDLRTLPELSKDEILYPYLDHQEELDGNDFCRKLASLEFASQQEKDRHMEEVIQDRIIELFGPDSELEQRIARFTLIIRRKIPYCIKNRTDKFQKIWLLKSIFHRRRLLTQLRDIDHERFEWLLRELKIRYVIPQDQEPYKGWKYNLKAATEDQTLAMKREKLEEFKVKLAAEKEVFKEQKAKILAEIDKDLVYYGLSRDFLDELQKKHVEETESHAA